MSDERTTTTWTDPVTRDVCTVRVDRAGRMIMEVTPAGGGETRRTRLPVDDAGLALEGLREALDEGTE